MFKGKPDKLEPKSEVCLLVGYPKETRGYLFYSHKDNKVFVSTNAKFLENDYMNNFTSRSRVVLVEMNEPVNERGFWHFTPNFLKKLAICPCLQTI